MPRATKHPKLGTFNFRLDPALKAAFTRAAQAEDKPAAQILRDFMRAYVERRNNRAFEAEARRQSREAAARARDPQSDEARSLTEMEAFLDEDHFGDEWTA